MSMEYRGRMLIPQQGIGFMNISEQQSEALKMMSTHEPKGGETPVRASGYSNITKISQRRLATPRFRLKDVVVGTIQ